MLLLHLGVLGHDAGLVEVLPCLVLHGSLHPLEFTLFVSFQVLVMLSDVCDVAETFELSFEAEGRSELLDGGVAN